MAELLKGQVADTNTNTHVHDLFHEDAQVRRSLLKVNVDVELSASNFPARVSSIRAASSPASRGGGSNCLCGSQCSSVPGMEFSPPV